MPFIGSDKGANVHVSAGGTGSAGLIGWIVLLVVLAIAALAIGGALAAPFQGYEKVTRAQADLERERAIAQALVLKAQADLEQTRANTPAQAEGTLRVLTALAIALLLSGFGFALYGIGRYGETVERRRIERERLAFEIARRLPASLAWRIIANCPFDPERSQRAQGRTALPAPTSETALTDATQSEPPTHTSPTCQVSRLAQDHYSTGGQP